jgi:hypothetical protein
VLVEDSTEVDELVEVEELLPEDVELAMSDVEETELFVD